MNTPRISDSVYRTLFSSAQKLVSEAKANSSLSAEEVEGLLNRRNGQTGLLVEDATKLLLLIHGEKSEAVHVVLKKARQLRKEIFHKNIATMAPIEISSFCSSNCTFCGWRSDNHEMVRIKISEKALIEQTLFLAKKGFSHLEISSGDDLSFIREGLKRAVHIVKTTAQSVNPKIRVSICITPLLFEHYQDLNSDGLDCVLTWQETYDPFLFKKLIPRGPKAHGLTSDFKVDLSQDGYLARLQSHESAVRAGLQVGIGTMLGISNQTEAEVLSCIQHGKYLIEAYQNNIQPLIIGMPIWNQLTTAATDMLSKERADFDAEKWFEFISAVYLLSFPDGMAWIFPNCRVSRKTQIESILTAGFFTSTMVRVGPGAYLTEMNVDNNLGDFFDTIRSKHSLINKEILLKGEQFKHYFDTHESYMEAFHAKQLETVSETDFLFKSRSLGE